MKTIGIIAEYNPFHNGHLYQIERIRKQYPDATIVVVLGGNFTQRGEACVLDKWTKTEIALNYVDLVVELPFPFATQSADIFAQGAIEILHALNVDILFFGSESNNIEMLSKLAEIELYEKEYPSKVQHYLEKGDNYPTALAKALSHFTEVNVLYPNDLLALSYIKEIKKQHAKIQPVCIQRTNSYHEKQLKNTISSASSIRLALKEKKNIQKYVPKITLSYLKDAPFDDNYFPFLKYKLCTTKDLSIYQTVDEGIEVRLKKYILESSSYEEFIQKVKTKRYTYNKIRRMLLHILVGFTKEDAREFQHITYLRILGFGTKGKDFLKQRKKDCILPIITTFQKENPMLQFELQVTAVYASSFDETKKQELLKKEYTQKPIMKNCLK